MGKFYVYCLLDTRKPEIYKVDNYCFNYQPFYIGKGCNTRCYDHFKEVRKLKNKRFFLYKKITKILKDGFEVKVKILKDNLTEEQAFRHEIELIDLIGRFDKRLGPLVNCTDGGDGLSNPSFETRQKISQKNKGKKLSVETRAKIGVASKNRVLSKEAREKISKKKKGKSLDYDTKKKISNTLKEKYQHDKKFLEKMKKVNLEKSNIKVSQETRDKRSFAMKNRDPVLETERRQKISEKLKGIKRSKEFKEKVSKFHKNKKVSSETRLKISLSVQKQYAFKNRSEI